MWIIRLQRLSIQFFLDILYFPVWWYSKGLLCAGSFFVYMFNTGNVQFSPWLWLKNIFVPMFGQYDWQGRLMSFFMRGVNVVFRTIALFVWTIVSAVLVLLWILSPIVVVATFIWVL
jgi:hypothetical protein